MRLSPPAFIVCLLLSLSMLVNSAQSAPRQDATLATAAQVLTELRSAPDQNVPNWLLERAYAVAVVPNVIKISLIAGGRRGSGVLVTRKPDGNWGNPVFVNLTGGSFGLQWGVQSTDIMLVFTSKASIEGIMGGKVTLGADAAVAAGPVGRQTAAATDIGFNAQIYSYSRSKGLFIGISLDGSALTIDQGSNAAFYEIPGILASDIMAGNVRVPASTQVVISALNGTTAPAPTAPMQAAAPTAPVTGTGSAPAQQPTRNEASGLVTYPMEDSSPGSEPPP